MSKIKVWVLLDSKKKLLNWQGDSDCGAAIMTIKPKAISSYDIGRVENKHNCPDCAHKKKIKVQIKRGTISF